MTTDSPPPAAPPQLSPDGYWWWTGTEWVPASQRSVAAEPIPVQAQPEPVLPAQPVHEQPAPAWAQPAQAQQPVPDWATPPVQVQQSQPAWPQPGQPQATPYGWGPQPGFAPVPQKTDGLAIASLVLSLPVFMGCGSIPALICGHLSNRKNKKAGRPRSGLATAGLILGYIGLFIMVAAVLIPVFLNQRQQAKIADIRHDLNVVAAGLDQHAVTYGTYVDVERLEGVVLTEGVQVSSQPTADGGYCLTAWYPGTHLYRTYNSTDRQISTYACE